MHKARLFVLGMTIVAALGWAAAGSGGLFEDLVGTVEGLKSPRAGGLTDGQVISGLKEALSVGTANAVAATSKLDGYFANTAIKILVPERARKVAALLEKAGFRQEVDDFVLSMNRAAEKAAPQARVRFVAAIKEMTFDDARKILRGDDTAATTYFEGKTRQKLYDDFQPVVSRSMEEVGVTRSYKRMMAQYTSLPFTRAESLDLDRYVTERALDGLFHMLGQEEKKIRTDPAARVTDILKTVFGSASR